MKAVEYILLPAPYKVSRFWVCFRFQLFFKVLPQKFNCFHIPAPCFMKIASGSSGSQMIPSLPLLASFFKVLPLPQKFNRFRFHIPASNTRKCTLNIFELLHLFHWCFTHLQGTLLKRWSTSDLKVLIFIPALSHAAAKSFNARWRPDSASSTRLILPFSYLARILRAIKFCELSIKPQIIFFCYRFTLTEEVMIMWLGLVTPNAIIGCSQVDHLMAAVRLIRKHLLSATIG